MSDEYKRVSMYVMVLVLLLLGAFVRVLIILIQYGMVVLVVVVGCVSLTRSTDDIHWP